EFLQFRERVFSVLEKDDRPLAVEIHPAVYQVLKEQNAVLQEVRQQIANQVTNLQEVVRQQIANQGTNLRQIIRQELQSFLVNIPPSSPSMAPRSPAQYVNTHVNTLGPHPPTQTSPIQPVLSFTHQPVVNLPSSQEITRAQSPLQSNNSQFCIMREKQAGNFRMTVALVVDEQRRYKEFLKKNPWYKLSAIDGKHLNDRKRIMEELEHISKERGVSIEDAIAVLEEEKPYTAINQMVIYCRAKKAQRRGK
ncbi:hypothetical protein BGZ76_004038, partial [Entomortierella beljakovae]